VARSSTKSEYKAIANITAEMLWLRYLLHDIGFTYLLPTTLWCDNLSVIHLTSNPIFHGRTKHIKLDYHFVREQVRRGAIAVRFITGQIS
jgi:hypothetical protein